MAKSKSTFVCQNCGNITSKWTGKCESCQSWNSVVEEKIEVKVKPRYKKDRGDDGY